MSLQIYHRQCAGAELAICTAHVEGRRVGPRVLLRALHHYALLAKIILADFNLAVSTLIIKLSNLIFRQIYRLYGISYLYYMTLVLVLLISHLNLDVTYNYWYMFFSHWKAKRTCMSTWELIIVPLSL